MRNSGHRNLSHWMSIPTFTFGKVPLVLSPGCAVMLEVLRSHCLEEIQPHLTPNLPIASVWMTTLIQNTYGLSSLWANPVLTQDGNVEGLGRLNAKWVDGAMSRTPHRRVILDDSSESPVHGEQDGIVRSYVPHAAPAGDLGHGFSPVHGEQEGASYNGQSMCYHPLFVFNQFGDCEGAMLRAGNVHSAHRWRDVLDPILSRYGATGVRRYFRADAAFAKPDIYEYLEERRVFYAIRLPSNKVLQWEIAPLLIRPVGRPPAEPVIRYDDFWYRAGSWDRARRVVAKVEWHRGELFPRVGFIVTNMPAGPEGVVRFYNGRGTAEQWIKEGKYALNWTRLGHRFWPTGCVCICSSWRTTLGTSFAGCVCPRRSNTGRCGACRSS